MTICLALTLLSSAHISHAAPAQLSHGEDDPQARKIVDRVAHLFSSKSSIATLKMQITNENGPRSLSMKIWSLGEKVLVRINAPQDEAGTAILKVGRDIWYYLPKSKRTIKLPISMTMNSWMGSAFTIDDLVKESFLTRDYSITTSFEGERRGVAVYEYTLTPRPEAAVVWGKIVLQIRQANLMPAWQGYYDEEGKLVRELTFSDYKQLGGRLIPTRLVMRAADKPGEQTAIVYEDISFDASISEDTFSLPNLKR
ncbi:MAG TPA: outer membrane lipoprotein-sorting protein [Candidatus Angelobacter sp.]|nr:outer membrane lipoprotein-sorting protein [Candidatus Angelobacter sp.]